MRNLLVFLSFLLLSSTSYGFKVVIDPGHGGHDNGATTKTHKEARLTLKLAQLLYKKLKSDRQFAAVLTRDKNRSVGLQTRTQIANHIDADLFVSIHANSSTDSRAKGAEFYFQNQLSADEESMFLANKENLGEHSVDQEEPHKLSKTELIIADMERNINIHKSSKLAISLDSNWSGLKKRSASSVRQAPFYVITNTKMPSILVEVGYLTNEVESKKLTQSRYQKALVNDIYKAIISYKNKVNTEKIFTL